jgi:hypothetical protein
VEAVPIIALTILTFLAKGADLLVKRRRTRKQPDIIRSISFRLLRRDDEAVPTTPSHRARALTYRVRVLVITPTVI